MPNILINETPFICGLCKGECCKHYAGTYHPSDFKNMKEELINLAKNKLISIDKWDGYIEINGEEAYDILFPRPRHKNSNELEDYTYGGECIYLTETGCMLSFYERPYGCRSLHPVINKGKKLITLEEFYAMKIPPKAFVYNNFHCDSKFLKYDAAVAWYPFQNILENIIKSFEK